MQGGVDFDITGDGKSDHTAWTVAGANDAFLYFDMNHNVVIDSGKELFGEVTVLPDGRAASNGFEALAAYDRDERGGNGDGAISPSDAVWGQIRLWVDRNHDGVMINSENYTLGQLHVVQINLSYVVLGPSENYGIDPAGNRHRLRGSFVRRINTGHGEEMVSRPVDDVYFQKH